MQLKIAAFRHSIHPPPFSATYKADGLPLRSAQSRGPDRSHFHSASAETGGTHSSLSLGILPSLSPLATVTRLQITSHLHCARGHPQVLKFCTKICPVYLNRELWGLAWLFEELREPGTYCAFSIVAQCIACHYLSRCSYSSGWTLGL